MRIYIKTIPRSSNNEVTRISEGQYKVKLTAPPVDNVANDALVEILSRYFERPKSCIKIVVGRTAQMKIIDIK